MLSSALRVGLSRVSTAAKRRLLPTINAGIFLSFFSQSLFYLHCVHVELVVSLKSNIVVYKVAREIFSGVCLLCKNDFAEVLIAHHVNDDC